MLKINTKVFTNQVNNFAKEHESEKTAELFEDETPATYR